MKFRSNQMGDRMHAPKVDVKTPRRLFRWKSWVFRAANFFSGQRVSGRSVLSLWRDASLLAAALAYLAGWAYIRNYFRQFEIDAALLDIGFNDYLVYAFMALSHLSGLLLVGGLVIAIGALSHFAARVSLYTAVLAVSFFCVYSLAGAQGIRDGQAAWALVPAIFPEVHFKFKDDEFRKRVAGDDEWVEKWYLVKATKDRYVVVAYKKPDFPGTDVLPATTSLMLPASEVAAFIAVNQPN
jgi:hypothetical protein